MEPETDEALMQKVARGDESAFAAIYDRFAGTLHALARRILGDEQEARDALQEGFLYIWDHAPQYDPARSKAFSWAVMIFRNKAIDRLRASRRRFRLGEMAADFLLDLEGPATEAADAVVDRTEQTNLVRRALHSLPEEQRKCIEWAFLRGFTHVQLAELIGAPLGTIKTNIRRGLLRLRDILQEGAAS